MAKFEIMSSHKIEAIVDTKERTVSIREKKGDPPIYTYVVITVLDLMHMARNLIHFAIRTEESKDESSNSRIEIDKGP